VAHDASSSSNSPLIMLLFIFVVGEWIFCASTYNT
jgi:hypothetical protein